MGFFTFPKKFSDNKTIFRYTLLLFLGWRASLLFITFLGLSLFPTLDFYHKKLFFPSEGLNYWNRWANWDSGAFLYISQHGYPQNWTVFFPCYPVLIKLISLLGLNPFWSGFLISQICTIIFLFFLFKLVSLDFDTQTTKRVLFATLIFPTSFYFASLYTESLFLAVTIAAFYFARKRNWLLASLFASLASVTRPIGIGVILAIFTEYFLVKQPPLNLNYFINSRIGRLALYSLIAILILTGLNSFFVGQESIISGVLVSVKEYMSYFFLAIFLLLAFQATKHLLKFLALKKIFSKNFLFLLCSFLPLIAYLFFLKIHFNSYLTFIHGESIWGKTLTFPWDGPTFSLSSILTSPLITTENAAHNYIRFLSFSLAFICLVISYYKLRLSYTLFYLIAFIIPLFSGTIADFTRYILVIFPMFIILGTIKNELIQKLGALLSILTLSMLTILYFNGYFFT